MSFFYDLNKKLDSIRATPEVTHKKLNERDMGKHNNATTGFKALADKTNDKIAGAQFQKMKKAGQLEEGPVGTGKKIYNVGKKAADEISDVFTKGNKLPDRDMKPGETFDTSIERMRDQDRGTVKRGNYVGMEVDPKTGAYVSQPPVEIKTRVDKTVKKPNDVDEGLAGAGKKIYDLGKRAASGINKMIGHGSDEEMLAKLKKDMGVIHPTGDKRPTPPGMQSTANPQNFADKIAGAKKEVDEMLGDVAAEAMRNALSPKQQKMAALGGNPERIDGPDLAALRKGAKMGEENAFDYKTPRSMNKGEKKTSSTGGEIYQKDNKTVVHTAGRHYGGGDEPNPNKVKRTKAGRPENTNKQPERVTANATKHKGGRKVKEGEVDIRDQGEYDQEGDMAKNDIKTIVRHAQALSRVLGDNDNLPEWVQSKLAKIEGMMISVDEYMQNQSGEDDEEAIAEEPRSKNQAVAARIARGVQTGTAKAKPGSASAEMAKMQPKELNKFAKGSTKGLPKKVSKNKAVDEADENSDDGRLITKQTGPGQSLTTSTTGRVSATIDKNKMSVKPGKSTDDDADTASVSDKDTSPSKSNSMVGKGIYDSMNRELELMIAESMSVNMSDSTEGNKSLTVTATDDDAMKLAMILKSAGLGGSGGDMHSHGEEACDTCGMQDCGCGDVQEAVDENAPDWPTNTETSSDALQYAGGLNKPKTDVAGDGQTTVPNTAVHSQDSDLLRRIKEMAGIKNEDNIDLGPPDPDTAHMTPDEVNAAFYLGSDGSNDDMTPDEVNAELGIDQTNNTYEDSIQRMREMAGIREAKQADKDYDGDGKIESGKDEHAGSVDKAIKKAQAEKKVDESIFALTNQWRAYKG